MKIEQIDNFSASRIVTTVSRAAFVSVFLLGMVGCAISGDENGVLAADEEMTEEASLAIDAFAPIAPEDPGTTTAQPCPNVDDTGLDCGTDTCECDLGEFED
jgi:hypothetical protein